VHTYHTTSWNSIKAIMSTLEMASDMLGGKLRGLPCVLKCARHKIKQKDGRSQPQTLVHLEIDGSLKNVYDFAKQKLEGAETVRALAGGEDPGPKALPTFDPPSNEPDEFEQQQRNREFFPEADQEPVSPEDEDQGQGADLDGLLTGDAGNIEDAVIDGDVVTLDSEKEEGDEPEQPQTTDAPINLE